MDFGFSPDDGERYARHVNRFNTATDIPPPLRRAEIGFGEMLDRIERSIDADPALMTIFANRFASRLVVAEEAKVSLDPFPIDPGTVLLAIWDNQPHGKRVKLDGDNSRDKPARYALDIRATVKGHAKPLTTKTPDFRANVGDLFTPDQIRARIKRAWKGIDLAEAAFLTDGVLPIADEGGYLVARLCLKRAAKQGGGTHWHPFHYALVSSDELEARAVSGVLLLAGQDRAYMLPRCETLDSTGKRSGARTSVVIGQSRATDLTSSGMRAWATGELRGG